MEDNLPELTKTEVNEIVELYKSIYKPSIKLISARVRRRKNNTTNFVFSTWGQRNLERGSSIKILRSMLSDETLKTCTEIDAVDISQWSLNSLSKSENLKAVVHSITASKTAATPEYYLEIWSEGKSFANFNLTALDVHGVVYSDDTFGSLCWSPQEDKILYIAEKKQPKTSPFYQQKGKQETESDEDKKEDTRIGEQYVYEDDWGETLSPKRQPVIAVCDIMKKSISILEGVPQNISPGQVIWHPNGDGVIGVGFENTPRRLGLVYCTNRISHIFYLTLEGKYVTLSGENLSVQSPRFSPDGKYLVWLQRPFGGPHHAVHSLVKLNWSTKEITTVVDYVEDSIATKNGKQFYGIYCVGLNERCWTSDSKYFLLSSTQKYRISSYAINIENGDIWDISSTKEEESTTILDVSEDNYVLASTTSFKQPQVLSSLHVTSVIKDRAEPKWIPLTKPNLVSSDNILTNFTVFDESSKTESCFATYYGPEKNEKNSVPLVVYPHGGPHSSVPNIFSPAFYFFSKLGNT